MSKIERRGFLKACAAGVAYLPGREATTPLKAEEARAGISVQPSSGQVRLYQGKPTLFINDKPVYAMLYALTDVPGGRWTWEERQNRQ